MDLFFYFISTSFYNARNFLFKSRLGKKFTKILETPLFVGSSITPTVQIADIFAGIARQYYEQQLNIKEATTDFEKWLSKLYEMIYRKTENFLQPNSIYYEHGFQYIENLNYIKKHKKPLTNIE